jgi:hypothetical protein
MEKLICGMKRIVFTTAALEMGEEGRLIADMDRGINAQ